MAPGNSVKRKRTERQTSQDEGQRPSPHRPDNLNMARHEQLSSPGNQGRGGRRQNRPSMQSPGTSASTLPAITATSASPATDAQTAQSRETPATQSISYPAPPSRNGTQTSNDHSSAFRAPFSYEYVTDAALKSWSERSKELIALAVQDGISCGVLLQELIRSALDGRLNAIDAGSLVRRMIEEQSIDGPDIQLSFLNTLSLVEDEYTSNAHLVSLLAATGIDPEIVRQELDVPLLQGLGLVRNTFDRIRGRKITNLLYRQANFNLLREETEGYAKLITEYFTTANDAVHDPTISAEDAVQRVMALVGSFDLDVGRVLDITLDISANLLVRAYMFFVKFYRCSSWWPDSEVADNVKYETSGPSSFPEWGMPGYREPTSEFDKISQYQRLHLTLKERDSKFWARAREIGIDAFFELGLRKITNFEAVKSLLENETMPEYDSRGKELNIDRRRRINENRKYMRETKTVPPQGNPDAAQLLGFKFRFYASSERDVTDNLPENLIYLAALLIKIGFISLRDLYPHLYPEDDQMQAEKALLEKEKREKEAKERPGGGANALALAGALPDDTIPAVRNIRDEKASGGSTPKFEKKEEEPTPELPAPLNQKIQLLKALLLIGALPEALYILGKFPWIADVDASFPPYLHRVIRHMLRGVADSVKPLRDRPDIQYPKDELRDNAPDRDGTLRFQQRPTKRTTKWLGLDLVEPNDGATYRHYYLDWDHCIPACQTVDDVFLLCNTLMGYLGVKIGQDPALFNMLVSIAQHDLTLNDSIENRARWLELMKRLLVPALSLSKNNPGLNQSIYELLSLFPTATRFNIYAEWYTGKTSRLPDMRVAFDHNKAEAKDVLRRVSNETGKKQARALAKIALSSPGIVMVSMINQLESYSNMIPSLVECTRYFSPLAWDVLTWSLLNSLSGQGRDRIQADGMLTSPWLQALSRFVATLFYRYSIINPTPVLQYLAYELRAGNSTDLEMLEQVLVEMGGIKSDMEFNDAQVLAMAGGEHLQSQIVLQLADKRNTRKSSASRLVKALGEYNLIGQTLIAIAQERYMYPYREAAKYMPLKVLGNNLDKIQQVFAQYLEVLKTNMTVAEFEQAIPEVTSLIGDFGLEPGIAFTICRFMIVGRISKYDADKKLEVDLKKAQLNQDKSEEKPPAIEESATAHDKMDISPAVNDGNKSNELVAGPEKKPIDTPWHPVLETIITGLGDVVPDLAERVSIPFFVTFWTLTLQDILVHTPSYDKEINKLREQIKAITSDRSDVTAVTAKERERKKKAATETQDKLREELKGRIAAYQKTRNRLSRREKDHWFSRSSKKEDTVARHLGMLQECFLPRAVLSSLDAQYCFLMLKMLHDNGTPGFSMMHFTSELFKKCDLAATMFQCTAMEAQHFGRFLCEILKLLQHWHSDKAIYEKEALGGKQKLPSFAIKWDAKAEPVHFLDFEQFRRLLFNWHSYLKDSLQMCFESGEYMHTRNGIIVLRSIVQVFPALNFMGYNMVKHVTRLSEEDSRQDLKLAAMSLLGPLRNREKQWMMPQAFRLNETAKDGGKGAASRSEAVSATDGTKLNAAAPEFSPANQLPTNGTSKKESGPEDGEIDEKTVSDRNGDVNMKDTPPAQSTPRKPKGSKTTTSMENKTDVIGPKQTTEHSGPILASSITPSITRSSQADSPRPPFSGSRPQHSLPNKPEYAVPKKGPPPPTADRTGRHSSRPDEKFGRLDRPSDLRPDSREQSPNIRSVHTPDRDAHGRGLSRDERGAARDDRGPGRSFAGDDGYMPSRRDADRPNGTRAAPNQGANQERVQPRSTITGSMASRIDRSDDHSTSANHTPTTHLVNPARLALINDGAPPERARDAAGTAQDSRRERDARHDRGPAWADSRTGGRSFAAESPRDEHHADQHGDATPTGPRNGRAGRDTGNSMPQESTYGRLNTPYDGSTGKGAPVGPQFRGNRPFSGGPPPTFNARPNEPSAPQVSGSNTNEGPGLRGSHRRQSVERRASGQHFERQQPPAFNSAPSTPAAESGPPIHPSRLAQTNAALVANAPGDIFANGSRAPGPPHAGPPVGPRGVGRQGGPGAPASGASSGQDNPFGGPGGPMDKSRRGDRPRSSINASINATLQNSGGASPSGANQTVSFRGAAANRASNMTQAPPAQPQALASSMEPPLRRNEAPFGRNDSRHDLFQGPRNRSGHGDDDNGMGEGHREATGGTREYRGRDEERGRDHDRFGQQPRSSRNGSRERRADDGPGPTGAGGFPAPSGPASSEQQKRRQTPREDLLQQQHGRDDSRDRRGDRPSRAEGMRSSSMSTLGSFDHFPSSAPGPEFPRNDNRRNWDENRRGGPTGQGRGGGSMRGRGDYRGGRGAHGHGHDDRREAEVRGGGGGSSADNGTGGPPPSFSSNNGPRKRRNDDPPPAPFDEPKRRRGGR